MRFISHFLSSWALSIDKLQLKINSYKAYYGWIFELNRLILSQNRYFLAWTLTL